ncbi:FkbM family methyltransferase [Pseudomonas nitroreducens]|uniref:FkbM family methyltransferase n=1 Tax=Pseudomonas nitroreducens TaxID=46680 RepID=A0ABS0KJ09_PSENT|nr:MULTISPECIES: FkbM family methyltransferase [unclassified Pseudomonas]MBG6288060.1 FkbM family methyltransferase [Pseudomonas nitroreducens]NMZ76422.1 FkbM family methyltransferase [Pseudomonas nitroreducens]OBY56373.1 hypothetical protein A9513_019370 [Pseudomonas sp. AU12215]UCL85511.1 FkbM family methyltransferase [Pseudomonas sp. HS-18]
MIGTIEQAIAHGTGGFSEVEILPQDDTLGLGRSRARNLGVAEAGQRGADWIFFIDADELMAPTAFADVEHLLADHDAIWGAIYEANLATQQASRRANDVAPITTLEQVLINHPFLTLHNGHFVRQEVAEAHPFNTEMDCGEDFEYYLRVWRDARCIKIEKPLFLNVRGQHSTGPRAATGKDWNEAMPRVFANFCSENEVIASVPFADKQVRFRLSNTLDLIQNQLAREQFFETNELSETLLVLPRNPIVFDVGANIGNHALFFACIGQAAETHCFEPTDAAADLLEENFALNGISPSSAKIHRIGIGAKAGKASFDHLESTNLGATSIKCDDSGEIVIDSLDNLYPETIPDLLKIDVEGMELDVLQGAQALIERSRPAILIEVANANKGHFLAWAGAHDYRIHRAFELVNASNYLLLPQATRPGFYDGGVAATREWTSRMPLAKEQPPCGWSIQDYLVSSIGTQPTLELILTEGRLAAKDITNRQEYTLGDNALADLSQRFAGKSIFLGELLGTLSAEQFSMILKGLKHHQGDVLLLDLMDSRWNNAFNESHRYRDAEWYLTQANQHGFQLHRYQKLPHKAASGAHEQLDSRLTFLHLKHA